MLGSVRSFLARKSAQHVEVYTTDAFATELVPVHSARKSVETYTLKPEFSVKVLTLPMGEKQKCKVEGFSLSQKRPEAKGFRVKLYTKQDVKVRTLPPRRKINIFKGTKKIQGMPIELDNKLKFLKNKPPLAKNEAILAWYWPIVDNAVIKLALDKQRGKLLVWYNPDSRHGKARGLYLIRRLALGAKPEWRWV
ncbi:MAG: hypothetical protein IJR85_00935 [Synergistaceae bacterium]|nr:hypothetical protein [Synergistaceae bacterium]